MATKKRVLILDDELDVAYPLQLLLEGHGFEAEATISVTDFEERFERKSWDAILLDVYLPTKSGGKPIGIDIAQRIRKDRPGLPIVLISGCSRSAEIKMCAEEIGATVVWKPFKMGREVIEAISSLIEGK